MKNRILTLLLLFTSGWIFAQQSCGLQGTVKDAGSKEALTGVTVFVESLKKGTSTDIDGHYELSLTEGSYDISFSFVGYITETRYVNIHNSVKTLDINLKVDNKILDEVVISSQRKDANVRELKMSVQTIDMVRIKKIPALMGEVDVIKTIQLMPGVHAASEGSSGFSVRGGNPDQNLILLDNVPIYNASHFLGFFSIFNNDVIKDATLYKGDIPAMYDSRLSSVLDITTLDEIPHKFNIFCALERLVVYFRGAQSVAAMHEYNPFRTSREIKSIGHRRVSPAYYDNGLILIKSTVTMRAIVYSAACKFSLAVDAEQARRCACRNYDRFCII